MMKITIKKQEHQANKELKRPDCTTGANVYPIKGLLPNLQIFLICQYDNNGFDTRLPRITCTTKRGKYNET